MISLMVLWNKYLYIPFYISSYIYEFILGVSNMQTQKVIHYPNLSTMLEVEKVLKSADEPISREEIKRRLPTKIMHQTLNIILTYMERRGLIHIGEKGILWTYNPSPKLQKAMSKGVEI